MGHFIAAQVYDVKIYDPVTAVSLGLCALMAGIIPAQHAASVEPIEALRSE
jgi:ABC-type lipoprotein release transport system permease subunit